jgi:hypothetical protein
MTTLGWLFRKLLLRRVSIQIRRVIAARDPVCRGSEEEILMTAVTKGSALAVLVVGLTASVTLSPAQGSQAMKSDHQIYVVQGVPGASVDVTVDGDSAGKGLATKDVIGPLSVSGGSHTISFDTDDWSVGASFDADKPSQDIVVHWPADPTDMPEVTVFTNDIRPVPAGKGRLTVAHTAIVPPADVRVNSKVLFANIANGEFVTAVVPASTYSVDIVPTGESTNPLFGPVDLQVKAGVLTRVFAIGEPENGGMDAIVQVLPVARGGSPAPGSVDAGEAGYAATERPVSSWGALLVVVVIGGLGLIGWGAAVGARRGRASE